MSFVQQEEAVFTEVIVPVTSQIVVAETQITNTISTNTSQVNYLFLLYCAGLMLFSLVLIRGLLNIFQLYRKGDKEKKEGYTIVTLEKELPAFSFHNWIFVSQEQRTSSDFGSILDHELCHVRQNHTLDVLIIEVVKIIFWCSPVIYLYKNAIKELHEFIADNAAIKNTNKREYGELLLGYTSQSKLPALTNPIFQSHLKTRIKMMLCKKTSKFAAVHYALVLPLVLLMALLFSGNKEQLAIEIEQLTSTTFEQPVSKNVIEQEVAKLGEKDQIETKRVASDQTEPNQNGSAVKTKCQKIRDKDIYMVFDMPASIETCAHLTGDERSKCARETLSQFFTSQEVFTEEALREGYQGLLAWTLVINEQGNLERVEKAPNLAKKNTFGLYEKGDRIIDSFKDQFNFVAGECEGQAVKSYILFAHKYMLAPEQFALVQRGTDTPFQSVTLMNASSLGGLGFEYRSNFKTPYSIKVYNPNMEEVHAKEGEYMYSASRGYVKMENPVNGIYTVVAMQDGKEVRNTLEVNVFSN